MDLLEIIDAYPDIDCGMHLLEIIDAYPDSVAF